MTLTDYNAKYFAYELTKRSPSDSVEKLAGALADAQVDLNPHQVDAALFAFRNPFSRGAILADEVGLGKTIEAGLLLSQHWAERKRKLLIILPANLRKQWSQELADKFHLPSVILESRTFNDAIKGGNLNPFAQSAIVLCSYQFARTKEPYIRQVAWDSHKELASFVVRETDDLGQRKRPGLGRKEEVDCHIIISDRYILKVVSSYTIVNGKNIKYDYIRQ